MHGQCDGEADRSFLTQLVRWRPEVPEVPEPRELKRELSGNSRKTRGIVA
jgi:hypothetical protein